MSDLEASRGFYEKKLGFEVKQSDEGYVEFATADVPLALMSLDAAADLTGKRPESDGVPRFSLIGRSIGHRHDLQELKAAGGNFLKEPMTQRRDQRTAQFIKPDGNL